MNRALWFIYGCRVRHMRKVQSAVMSKKSPKVFGVGLIALDVVAQRGQTSKLFAGGTCGNVLLALAYMGWQANPISRLALDAPGKLVRTEFEVWNADQRFLATSPMMATPVILEKLSKDASGVPYHSFSFSCPSCGGRLPMYQPVTLTAASQVIPHLLTAEVLFIDRISPSSIALAKAARQQGVIVYFEPSSVRDSRQFRTLLSLCHVVKYSQDRIDDIGDVRSYPDLLLEIQTLGRGGIRFRTRLAGQRNMWQSQAAEQALSLVDSTGSGDWFTASLINSICRNGLQELQQISLPEIVGSLNVAQGVAAWNCGFIGARGGMYEVERSAFARFVQHLRSGASKDVEPECATGLHPHAVNESICLHCEAEQVHLVPAAKGFASRVM